MNYYGNYRGFILRNDDPEQGNKVKVFVPAIHQNEFGVELLKEKDPLNYIGGLTQEVAFDIATKIPWAEVAQPLMGGSSGASYDRGGAIYYGDGKSPSTDDARERLFLFKNAGSSKQTPTNNVEITTYSHDGNVDPYANNDSNTRNLKGNANNLLTVGSLALSKGLLEIIGRPNKGDAIYFDNVLVGYYDDTSPQANPNLDIFFLDSHTYKTDRTHVDARRLSFVKGKGRGHTPYNAAQAQALKQSGLAGLTPNSELPDGEYNESDGGGLLPPKPNSGATKPDAFVGVGNKSPQEHQDRSFLSRIGASESVINTITDAGNKVAELRKKVVGDATLSSALKSAQDHYRSLWLGSDVDPEGEHEEELSNYIDGLTDYTGPPDNNHVNPMAQSYVGSVYNNVSRGSFSTPQVKSRVWVFFEGGDLDFPVVIADSPKTSDYKSIHKVTSATTDQPQDGDGNAYRDKWVMTHRGGSVETVNSDGRESISLSSYYGGSYVMSNGGTSESAPFGKCSNIHGDNFKTVWGHDSSFSNGNRDTIIKGNLDIKCGNVRDGVAIGDEMKKIHKGVHDIMQQFPLDRSEPAGSLEGSPNQAKSNENNPCYMCRGKVKFNTGVSDEMIFTPASISSLSEGTPHSISGGGSRVEERLSETGTCIACNGTGVAPWSAGSIFNLNRNKENIPTLIANNAKRMSELESQLGSGGNANEYYSKSRTIMVGVSMNDLGSIRVDPKGNPVVVGQHPTPDGKAMLPDVIPVPHVEPVAVSGLSGGDLTMMVCNKYEMFVGANGINMSTFGQLALQGRITRLTGEQVVISSNNEVEIDGGSITKITGDAISISPRTKSRGGVDHKDFAVNGTLGVSGNALVKGGVHIEGGISTQHIVAPVSYQDTPKTLSQSSLKGGIDIGEVEIDGKKYVVKSVPAKDFAVSAHGHTIANAPMTLLPTNDSVRSYANGMTGGDPIAAPEVENGDPLKYKRKTTKYGNPNWFEFFDDCDDSDTEQLLDLIIDGKITTEEAEELLTRSSDHPTAQTQRDNNCDPCS